MWTFELFQRLAIILTPIYQRWPISWSGSFWGINRAFKKGGNFKFEKFIVKNPLINHPVHLFFKPPTKNWVFSHPNESLFKKKKKTRFIPLSTISLDWKSWNNSRFLLLPKKKKRWILFSRLIKFVIFYSLCIIYNSIVCLWFGFLCIFKRNTRFWEIKERSMPDVLKSDEYGEHKYATVNVIFIYFRSGW